ncbi:galanin receptor 2a [Nematostella vectensis]|uniref:galanin receptor 2a n=1 Tax=Nematostella vectensis TaxID=45351 RepID=UPI001390374D|nr:galanin receptor 2a [Nematostella vectensis]
MAFPHVFCTNETAPSALPFVTGGISLLLFLLVVPGNFLILLAIYKDPNRELRKNPFNLFVGNLATADLLVGLLVLPISAAVHIREGLFILPIISQILAIHMSYFVACTASLLSLAALTLDRHIAVMYPLYYRTALNPRRAFVASALIWALSISLTFTYLKVGSNIFAFVFANISIAVSLFFLFSCLYITRRVGRRDVILENSSCPVNRCGRRRHSKLQTRTTRVFSFVLITYILCYGPSCVLIYLMNFCVRCSCAQIHWFRDLQFLFVLVNSCTNPILYSWRLKTFRNALKKLLGIKSTRQSSSSSTSSNICQQPSNSIAEVRSYQNDAIELVSFKTL